MPDDPTQVLSAVTPARRADAGLAWGTLIHGLLEHACGTRGGDPWGLRRLAGWLTVENAAAASGHRRGAGHSAPSSAPAILVDRAEPRALGGAPFTVADGNQLTNGVMDLLFESDAGWRVVDYKTDTGRSRMAVTPRSWTRTQAALRTLGCPVAGASVVRRKDRNLVTRPLTISRPVTCQLERSRRP